MCLVIVSNGNSSSKADLTAIIADFFANDL